MNINSAPRSKEPNMNEILAVKDFIRASGGKKRIEEKIEVIEGLIPLPEGFDSTRYAEVLQANLDQIMRLIEHAEKHGGLKNLHKDVDTISRLAFVAGGSLGKAKQAIGFLEKVS